MRLASAVVAWAVALPVTSCVADAPRPASLVALINASAPSGDVSATQFCAGVLVTPTVILTAGHCVEGRAAESMNAIIGADNLCSTGEIDGARAEVERVIVDDELDGAVVILEHAITESAPIQVAASFEIGDRVNAWGWGKASVGGVPPCRSQQKALAVVEGSECEAFMGGNSPGHLCARPVGERNTCEGDSGGPVLTQDGRLLAVTASGAGCGADDPGAYTSAQALLAHLLPRVGKA